MRPLNNVVDVTNYVMLEYGQPLHAFDYHKLKGGRIVVRRAGNGETVTTLDGSKRALSRNTLVIADEEKAVAVAGIMGGLDSEVTAGTHTVLLESANFNQATIRRGSSHLQFQSEASIRFDKGLNPELPLVPMKRATRMLLELAGGRAARGVIDVYPGKSKSGLITLTTREVKRLSGLKVDIDEILKVLKSLGFESREGDSGSQILVSIPYWRSDIKCSADLVEEVVRIIGYENVPMTRLSSPLPPQESGLSPAARRNSLDEELRDILVSFGFQEILTYSLVSLEKLQRLSPKLELKVPPLKVANPMTREQEFLRTSLQPSLLSALAHNQRFEQGGLRLFEIGKVFLPRGRDLPEEKEMLCAVLGGVRAESSWHAGKELLDFFDAKGVMESLLNQLGLNANFEDSGDEILSPGRAADVVMEGDKIGIVGDVHPEVAQAFELSNTVCLLEVDLEKLLTKIAGTRAFQSVPRFPSVSRDIALVVDEQVGYRRVKGIIEAFPLVKKVTLFDLYRGEQIAEGKKSFAIRIVYQSPDRTLTDEEVDRTQEQMLVGLRQDLGATLRV
jgi:phenylalanyl-tRNA synthetase beta chain